MMVTLEPLDVMRDRRQLVQFLTANAFPFHVHAGVTEEEVERGIFAGRFTGDGVETHWVVDVRGERTGLVIFQDLADETAMLDLRIAEDRRGQGLGRAALRAAADWLFTHHAHVNRFEGNTRVDNAAMRRTFTVCGWAQEAHYRQAWPVAGGPAADSVAYSILRSDWRNGTVTPVPWDGR